MTIQLIARPSRFCAASLIGLACVLLLLAACHKGALPGGLAKLKPCQIEGINETLLCGKLTVFENRETQAGRKIDLNVVVLPAFDQKTKLEPLFHLEGGPGVAATGVAGFYATDGKEYRRRHDVVLVDQRGTGQSNPLSIRQKKAPQDYLSEMYPVDYVKKMRETLERRADLTQYTTSIAMDDLDDVRAWLGYDRINLFGLSYGTRAALVYLRQHPGHGREPRPGPRPCSSSRKAGSARFCSCRATDTPMTFRTKPRGTSTGRVRETTLSSRPAISWT